MAAPTIARVVRVAATLFAAFVVAHWMSAGADNIVTAPTTAPVTIPEDCWTGPAPADVDMPGTVLVLHPGGQAERSSALVGPAFDAVFGAEYVPFTVLAFCR